MWDVGRSTIAARWNAGEVPPIQLSHGSLSRSSFSVLFSNLLYRTGTLLIHPSGTRECLFFLNVNNCRARLLIVPISTGSLTIDEEQPKPGSLFASRTLPPLYPHPRPQSYPLLRPSEWPPSSYRRDNEGGLRRLSLQGGDQPPYPILSSPLATSSSGDSHNQQ